MNKKVSIGTLLGAVILIAAIATAVSAAPGFAASSSVDDVTDTTSSNGMEGDCDQTKDELKTQDRDRLKDGSCVGCTGIDGEGEASGALIMNHGMVQLQEQQMTMSCASNGEGSGENSCQYMNQNGKV